MARRSNSTISATFSIFSFWTCYPLFRPLPRVGRSLSGLFLTISTRCPTFLLTVRKFLGNLLAAHGLSSPVRPLSWPFWGLGLAASAACLGDWSMTSLAGGYSSAHATLLSIGDFLLHGDCTHQPPPLLPADCLASTRCRPTQLLTASLSVNDYLMFA
jgi:hypothetical protein